MVNNIMNIRKSLQWVGLITNGTNPTLTCTCTWRRRKWERDEWHS